MSEEKLVREFKGVWIPKEIWLNEKLSLQERVLLAEIDSFETKNGCFASNAYLGQIIRLSPSRVSTIISKLVKLGYVYSTLLYKFHSSEIDKRILKVNKSKIYGFHKEDPNSESHS